MGDWVFLRLRRYPAPFGISLVLVLGFGIDGCVALFGGWVPFAAQPQQTPKTDALLARAEAGDAEAHVNLGFRYANGLGVPEDEAEAVRWWQMAADQGHADAQYLLGGRYFSGEGVPQDYVQAHMWYNLVAARSTGEMRELAVRELDRVADRLPPTQIAEAQRLAHEWDAAHPREPYPPRPR